jgi:hypothetical protein
MTHQVLLNNVEHRDLRIIRERGPRYGDDVMYALTFPGEFRSAQAHYPIVFARNPDGQFMPLALFGFREKQNLFVKNGRWDAQYMPLSVERHSFYIGNSPNGKVIFLDLDSPRVSKTDGEPLFKEDGANAGFLDHMSRVLASLDEGIPATQPFMQALVEHDLIESFVFDIAFRDGGQRRFSGFYTVNEERVAKLDGAAVARLHERGYLQAIYMVIASLSNLRALVDRLGSLDPADR